MRIVVMGSGGVGGYFGAKLAQAGHAVGFVARGRHLAAIREQGLRIKSSLGDFELSSPRVTDDPATLGNADVVLFAVKLWDTEAAAEAIRPVVAGSGVVIPFQNGVDSIDRIGAVVGREHVMGGVAFIAGTIGEPGVIVHTGTMARLRFGAALPVQQSAAEQFAAACKGAGIDGDVVADIHKMLWMKFGFLTPLAGMTAATRQPIGVVRSDPEMRSTFERAVREVWSLGRARGIAMPDDYVEEQMKFADGLPAEMRASMANDLGAGNRLEAPWLSGAVVRMARELGMDTPVNATLYAAVKPYVDGVRH